MGAWSVFSDGNDMTCDQLGDVRDLNQKKAYEIVAKSMSQVDVGDSENESYWAVGVVMWMLIHKWKVAKKYLEKAIELNRSYLITEDFSGWKRRAMRKLAVKQEIKEMERALENDGQLKRKPYRP